MQNVPTHMHIMNHHTVLLLSYCQHVSLILTCLSLHLFMQTSSQSYYVTIPIRSNRSLHFFSMKTLNSAGNMYLDHCVCNKVSLWCVFQIVSLNLLGSLPYMGFIYKLEIVSGPECV